VKCYEDPFREDVKQPDPSSRSDEHGDYGDRFIPNAPVERPHDVKTLGRSFYSGQANEKTARKRSLVSWD
jgi:hypothetical protein